MIDLLSILQFANKMFKRQEFQGGAKQMRVIKE